MDGGRENPLPGQTEPTSPHELWGGRPRPRPAPWPAFRASKEIDSSTRRRVQGDPRGPGGPPHQYLRRFAPSLQRDPNLQAGAAAGTRFQLHIGIQRPRAAFQAVRAQPQQFQFFQRIGAREGEAVAVVVH